MKIGILAIQGSVIEHRRVLEKLGVGVQEIRLPEDLQDISGIILPGGESTTQAQLLKEYKLFAPLKKKLQSGFPAWGTCTGAILLAKKITGKNVPESLAVMDIITHRNWYGGQRESFIADVNMRLPSKVKSRKSHSTSSGQAKGESQTFTMEGIFIRAPRLEKMKDSKVQILATHNNAAVMLQQNNLLVTAFHPELTNDVRIHEYFVEMCRGLKF